MGTRWSDGGYSSHTEARLLVGDQVFDVGNIGDSTLILMESTNRPHKSAPPGSASLVILVDDWQEKYEIILPSGVSSDPREPVKFF